MYSDPINSSYSTSSNQLETVGGSSISYNSNGQTQSKLGSSFSYNDENRLSQHTKSGQSTTYSYNALGQRVNKSNSSSTTRFFYDESGKLIAEYSVADNKWKEYIYLHGQAVGFAVNGALYYVHNDHLGRAERITNASKSTVWRANNHDFDRVVAYGSADWYNLGFPGQYYDSEKDSYYNYFRDYDPKTGRYIQSDPIGLAGGINTYAYVSGNPVNWFDFYGLERQECVCASATRKSPSKAYPTTIWHGYPNLEGNSGLEGYLEATPLTQQRADRYNAAELENANRTGFTPLGDALFGDLNPIPFSGTIGYFLGNDAATFNYVEGSTSVLSHWSHNGHEFQIERLYDKDGRLLQARLIKGKDCH